MSKRSPLDRARRRLPSPRGRPPERLGRRLDRAAYRLNPYLLARLAVVPLVLEARGLDVTPRMAARLDRAGDAPSAAILRRIYRDEIGHVAVGARWFEQVCRERGLVPEEVFKDRVRRCFKGGLKPPFNDEARAAAGLPARYYAPARLG